MKGFKRENVKKDDHRIMSHTTLNKKNYTIYTYRYHSEFLLPKIIRTSCHLSGR
jgi:hypothetical protein